MIDLPASLPLEHRVFIGWIAMVQGDDAAAGAVGAAHGDSGHMNRDNRWKAV
jgi:hypothetical protein